MAEYIDRDAFLKHLQKDPLYPLVEQYGITGVIELFPVSDVHPIVHSRWDKHGYACPCLNCGWDSGFGNTIMEFTVTHGYKYCPNCGARMDGET